MRYKLTLGKANSKMNLERKSELKSEVAEWMLE